MRNPLIDTLESRLLWSVTFALDYSLDATGFFSTSERRVALEAAADAVAQRLGDSIQAIVPSGTNTWSLKVRDPSTGGTKSFANPVVAAGTIPIYVGARNLAGSNELGMGGAAGYEASGSKTWLNRLSMRAGAGDGTGGDSSSLAPANPSKPGDTAHGNSSVPVGGSIVFDNQANWHFGLTVADLGHNQADFLSVAEHELMHVLGFSSGNAAFTSLINTAGNFTGAAASALYSSPVPTDGQAHWADGVISPAGDGFPSAETLMDPTLTLGTRKSLTALDFAGLQDIGWTLLPPTAVQPVTPVASISGGDTPVDEGASLTLSGAGSTVPSGAIVSYEWDTRYDGLTFIPRATGASVDISLADGGSGADGPATRTVALRVTSDTGATSIATQAVEVINVAPTATLESTPTGVRFTNISDVPADLGTLTYSFDLGDDGIIDQTGASPVYAFPAAAQPNDVRPFRATLTDKDGGKREFTGTATLGLASLSIVPTNGDIASVAEGDASGARFTLQLSSALTAPLTVILKIGAGSAAGTTASASAEDVQTTTLQMTIPAGSVSVPVFVVPVSDLRIEGDEAFVISINSVSGPDVAVDPAANSAVGLIIDDDTGSSPITMVPDPKKKGKGAVFVHGTAGADTLVIVKDAKHKLQLQLNNQTLVPVTSITRLLAFLGAGDDAALLGGLKVPLFLDGGDGTDTLVGGKNKDILIGGAGADSLRGGPGDDLLASGDYGDLSDASADASLLAWSAHTKPAVKVDALSASSSPFSATAVADDDSDALLGDTGNDVYLYGQTDPLPVLGKREFARSR